MTIFFTLPGTLDTVTVLIVVSQGITLKVKRPESEANHSPPSTAEVKSQHSYTSFPLHAYNLTYFKGIYIKLFVCNPNMGRLRWSRLARCL